MADSVTLTTKDFADPDTIRLTRSQVPEPPPGLKREPSSNGTSLLDHEDQRWRWNSAGKLVTYIEYKPASMAGNEKPPGFARLWTHDMETRH